mmetsp:Transcript_18973/g.45778  ORF Transcript_18973/g.45778 Transcript_18973/m.45778 type:complete len:278 (-) Transcript_18973:162-995(-)
MELGATGSRTQSRPASATAVATRVPTVAEKCCSPLQVLVPERSSTEHRHMLYRPASAGALTWKIILSTGWLIPIRWACPPGTKDTTSAAAVATCAAGYMGPVSRSMATPRPCTRTVHRVSAPKFIRRNSRYRARPRHATVCTGCCVPPTESPVAQAVQLSSVVSSPARLSARRWMSTSPNPTAGPVISTTSIMKSWPRSILIQAFFSVLPSPLVPSVPAHVAASPSVSPATSAVPPVASELRVTVAASTPLLLGSSTGSLSVPSASPSAPATYTYTE